MSEPKRLVWFTGRLLRKYHVHRSRFLDRQIAALPHDPRLDWHMAMFRLHQGALCMVDHTGLSASYGDGLNLEVVTHRSPDLNKTQWDLEKGERLHREFDALVNDRASQAYQQAEQIGADHIFISYSGGADSSLILAAMLQNGASKRWIDERRLVIRTTRYSMREDPAIWARLVEMDIPMEFHNYDDLMQDERKWMLVTGDVARPGGTTYADLPKGSVPDDVLYGGQISQLEPWFLEKDSTGLAFDYFRALQDTAPFPIETNLQAWWWFEWCTHTQCYMFRIPSYCRVPTISPEIIYPGQKQFWFLANSDFWDHGAYVTATRQIPEDSALMKFYYLNYVAKWMRWLDPKPKPKVFSQAAIPKITSKFRIWNDLTWDCAENVTEGL